MATCGHCKTTGQSIAHIRACGSTPVAPPRRSFTSQLLTDPAPTETRLIDAIPAHLRHMTSEDELRAERALERVGALGPNGDDTLPAPAIYTAVPVADTHNVPMRDRRPALPQSPAARTAQRTASSRPAAPAPEGIYFKDGEVYRVKESKRTGRRYAEVLVNFNGERLTAEGEHVKFEFDFAPGMVWKLTDADKMTVEQAKAFVLVYNSCLRCNRHLKAAKSVEQGIGPVCITYYA